MSSVRWHRLPLGRLYTYTSFSRTLMHDFLGKLTNEVESDQLRRCIGCKQRGALR